MQVGILLFVEIQAAAKMKFWMTCKFALVQLVYFLLLFGNHKGSASPVLNYTQSDCKPLASMFLPTFCLPSRIELRCLLASN